MKQIKHSILIIFFRPQISVNTLSRFYRPFRFPWRAYVFQFFTFPPLDWFWTIYWASREIVWNSNCWTHIRVFGQKVTRWSDILMEGRRLPCAFRGFKVHWTGIALVSTMLHVGANRTSFRNLRTTSFSVFIVPSTCELQGLWHLAQILAFSEELSVNLFYNVLFHCFIDIFITGITFNCSFQIIRILRQVSKLGGLRVVWESNMSLRHQNTWRLKGWFLLYNCLHLWHMLPEDSASRRKSVIDQILMELHHLLNWVVCQLKE